MAIKNQLFSTKKLKIYRFIPKVTGLHPKVTKIVIFRKLLIVTRKLKFLNVFLIHLLGTFDFYDQNKKLKNFPPDSYDKTLFGSSVFLFQFMIYTIYNL